MFESIKLFDNNVIFFINENIYKFNILQHIFKYISILGNGGIIWIIISCFFIFKKESKYFGYFILLALLFSSIIGNNILKEIFARQRPFIEHNLEIIIKSPLGYSLPSGHSLSSFTAATLIFMYNKRYGIFALILAFLIAISRVILLVHYPSDILVGSLIGIIIGLVFFKLYKIYKDK